MKWLRYYHETPNDPKWRAVATTAKCKVHVVLAVWDCMLVCASEANVRGTLEGWDSRVIAATLELHPQKVEAIFDAMQGLTLDGDRLLNWDKRQPTSDDISARSRKSMKGKRDREKAHSERSQSDDERSYEACERPDISERSQKYSERSHCSSERNFLCNLDTFPTRGLSQEAGTEQELRQEKGKSRYGSKSSIDTDWSVVTEGTA